MILNTFVSSLIVLLVVSTSASASPLRISKSSCWIEDVDIREMYRGECQKGFTAGKHKYEGEFVHDSYSGPGKYTLPGDAIYENYMVNGRQSRRAAYTWPFGEQNISEIPERVRQDRVSPAKQAAVTANANSEVVSMKLTLKVRADSILLTNQAKKELLDFANKVTSESGSKILVEGYTASDNNTEENLALSLHRAHLVKNILIENGVNPDQIDAVGRGIENPLAANTTRDGRSMNRRVEISVINR